MGTADGSVFIFRELNDWEGDAKDAALDRVAADLGVVRRQGDVQRHAADVAARGGEAAPGLPMFWSRAAMPPPTKRPPPISPGA